MASLPDSAYKDSKTFFCKICNNNYNAYKSLKRHVREKHPDQLDDIAPNLKKKGSCEFHCNYCPYKFSKVYNLRAHIRNVHDPEKVATIEYLKKCSLCGYECTKKEMFSHFEQQHDFNLEFLELNFDTGKDFEEWKKNIEIETCSRFVLERGAKKVNDGVKYNFTCFRSGFYNSKGKGLRFPKMQGSCKINGFCPASIKVVEKAEGSCVVHYISTHIGHQNDVAHLRISEEDRSFIASKIALKVPFDGILDEIRDSADSSDIQRIHLLTKKDLHNIEKSLNLIPCDKSFSLETSKDLHNIEKSLNLIPCDKSSSLETSKDLHDIEKSLNLIPCDKSSSLETSKDLHNIEKSFNLIPCDKSSLLKRKNRCIKEFIVLIRTAESEEDLKVLEDALKSIPPKFKANKSSQNPSSSSIIHSQTTTNLSHKDYFL